MRASPRKGSHLKGGTIKSRQEEGSNSDSQREAFLGQTLGGGAPGETEFF